MTPKEFAKYLERDGGCVHCGDRETAVPHHRANRGMGGSKARDVPSNIVAMCAAMNGAMESNKEVAQMARQYGWKLYSHQDPASTPVWDAAQGKWYLLGNDYLRAEYVGVA